MTGFEYTAAIGMLYEGQAENGLKCIASIRSRYDGMKRSPFDEAECGHHYGRAMISWAGLLALTGFHYSAVDQQLTIAPKNGRCFWSNGYAYGSMMQKVKGSKRLVTISSLKGDLSFKSLRLTGFGEARFEDPQEIKAGKSLTFEVAAK
jgi:non-lysosomal glucosylceramidase